MYPSSRTISFSVLFLFLGVLQLHAAVDYAARYKQLHDQHADGQMEAWLDEWRAKRPDDPDAWIKTADYYFNRALSPTMSTKKPEGNDYVIAEQDTGKVAGSLSFKINDALAKQAAEFLAEATKRFPNRLDIWCGLSYIHQERGDFESEFATLKSMVAYARSHPDGMCWLKGAPLPAPEERFLADKLHTYGLYYHQKGNLEDGKRFLQLALFAAEQFPHQVYAFNDVAAFYSTTGQPEKALEWLKKARSVNPKDVIVLMNLGDVCSKLGDFAAARKWYTEALRADPKGEYARSARDALTELGKK
jgi:tetratricopeptide (TPR) repeat protein